MPHSVYILKSLRRETYYVGQSVDPPRRLVFHNTTEKGFTSWYRPWLLVYTLACKTREEAIDLERKIKAWKSKLMIEKLIRGEITL